MGVKGWTWTLSVAALIMGVAGCEHLFHHHDNAEVEINFDSTAPGKLPEGWKVAETAGKGKTAKWSVVKDSTAPSGGNALALIETKNSGRTFNLLIAEEMGSYKDMEIELKIKSVSGKQDQGGGFIWRAKDADNYYVARWNPLEDNFRVYYVKNGKRQQIASAKIKADPNKWHEMEIKHFGTTIIAEFDDKELLKIEDKTFTKAGKVGLWTKADAATKFDDFVIKLEADDD